MSLSQEAILQQLMRKSNSLWVKAEIKRETFIVNNRPRQSQEIIGVWVYCDPDIVWVIDLYGVASHFY